MAKLHHENGVLGPKTVKLKMGTQGRIPCTILTKFTEFVKCFVYDPVLNLAGFAQWLQRLAGLTRGAISIEFSAFFSGDNYA